MDLSEPATDLPSAIYMERKRKTNEAISFVVSAAEDYLRAFVKENRTNQVTTPQKEDSRRSSS
jgi:hypothetical protein